MKKFVLSSLKDSIEQSKDEEVILKQRIKDKSYKSVYPILNQDFDYKNAIIKKYNPYSLGITNQPTMSNLHKHPKNLEKFFKILVKDKFPNKSSVAGTTDVLEDDKKRVKIKNLK